MAGVLFLLLAEVRITDRADVVAFGFRSDANSIAEGAICRLDNVMEFTEFTAWSAALLTAGRDGRPRGRLVRL